MSVKLYMDVHVPAAITRSPTSTAPESSPASWILVQATRDASPIQQLGP